MFGTTFYSGTPCRSLSHTSFHESGLAHRQNLRSLLTATRRYDYYVLASKSRPSPPNGYFWHVGRFSEPVAVYPNINILKPLTRVYPVQKSNSEVLFEPNIQRTSAPLPSWCFTASYAWLLADVPDFRQTCLTEVRWKCRSSGMPSFDEKVRDDCETCYVCIREVQFQNCPKLGHVT